MRAALLSLLASLLLSAPGCKPKGNHDAEVVSGGDEKCPPGTGGGGGFMGGSMLGLSSLFANAGQPGLYDALQESPDFDAGNSHLKVLSLEGPVVELATVSIFSQEMPTEMQALTTRLRELAEDDNVSGLVLRLEPLALSMATAQALKQRLIEFKGEGKRKLYCHAEMVENLSYVVMTACDAIGLAPTGQIIISGVAAAPIHLKGLLDELGVKADFLHVGSYKGAAEPLTLEEPSDAMKETLGAILDQSYASMVNEIASGRSIAKDEVKALIDRAIFNGSEALEAKLIDKEMTFAAFLDIQRGDLGWEKISLKEEGTEGIGGLMSLLGGEPQTRPQGDHIAVLHAVGNIIDGDGDGVLGSRGEIASHTLIAAIRSVERAESVKGVVLRVDSGGGSALASEQIWHALNGLKAHKPVVVSMGSVAASGGYYISAAAQKIYAEENTLTGSIGVVGGKLAIGGALEKIGIKSFPMARGERAMMWSMLDPWSPKERETVQTMMEDIYKVFVKRVAEGRDMKYEEVHEIAQGRVWTGKAALDHGLVDELGSIDDAIAHAAKLAGMDAPGELEIYPPEPTLMDYLGSFTGGVSARESLLLTEVGEIWGHGPRNMIAELLADLQSFRQARVQTLMLLPVVWQNK